MSNNLQLKRGLQSALPIGLSGELLFTTDTKRLYLSDGFANNLLQGSDSIFTTGSIPFSNSSGKLTTDSSNFYWDDTNNRLGIGTNTPTKKLDVSGDILVNAIIIGKGNNSLTQNTIFGTNTGISITTGNGNTFFGNQTGQQNNSGANNCFFGNQSGFGNTTGGSNTYIGSNSGFNNTTGSGNFFGGTNAGRFIANGITALTIANNSIFLGQTAKALADNQTNQIVIGFNATGLGSNTTVLGNSSTVLTAIYGNVLIGTTTDNGSKLNIQGSITASSAIARGQYLAPTLVASANNDVLVGLDIAPNYVGGVGLTNTISGGTLYTTGAYTNVLLTGGNGAGAIATIVVNSSGNVSVVTITTAGSGYYLGNILSCLASSIGGTGSGFTLTLNTLLNTGVQPIGLKVDGINIGRGGGYNIKNLAIGLNALALNNLGTNNFALGANSLSLNTIGNNNIAIGEAVLAVNINGSQNIGIGQSALQNNTGSNNLAIGQASFPSVNSGQNNLAFGRFAGRVIADKSTLLTSINNSILIGYQTSPLGQGQTNQVVIGHDSIGLGSNTTVLGNSSTLLTALYGNLLLGTTTDITSSRLTVNSTTQGFLPPRMTNAQRIAIATPAIGLCVYCTDATEGLYVNKSTGWTLLL